MYAVILAGGGGTRLWPLSDPTHPKPFLPLFDAGSLLQKTVRRLTEGTAGTALGLTQTDLTVVTDQRYEGLIHEQVPGVAVLSEPIGRNTAAAIALAALAVERDADEVMVVLPADHLVVLEDVFRGVLADAADELARGAFGIDSPIVTLGAQPTGPSTHYGYLVPDFERGVTRNLTAYPLQRFEEKPNVERAEQMLGMPGVAWNAGIFMARRRAFLDALRAHTELLDQLRPAIGDAAALAAAYERVNPISIDYAVMEPAAAAGQVVMASMDAGWSDVGTWRALLDALVAPDGGYDGAARVVQPGDGVTLEAVDLAVIRDADDRLMLERGPLELQSAQPIGFLPGAHLYAAAVQQLLTRVNSGAAQRVAARA
ncbi:MAG: sugar phosphate nucleotidyltransferase [Chloroflexota bacterium]